MEILEREETGDEECSLSEFGKVQSTLDLFLNRGI